MINEERINKLVTQWSYEASNWREWDKAPATLFEAIVCGMVGDDEDKERFEAVNPARVHMGGRELKLLIGWLQDLCALSIPETEVLWQRMMQQED